VRLAWSTASLPGLALDDDLAAAAAAGFDAAELWLPTLWPDLERHGPEGLASILKRRRIAAVALGPVADATFRDDAGRDRLIAEVHGAATLARQVGASWVVIQPGERPDGADERDALHEARDTLDRACRASERYDVGLALMPLGFAWASIRTLGQALRAIESVGRRSLGIAVDTFHFHLGGSSLDDLRQTRARLVALVRLADAPAGDREGLREHHRLVPGQGVAPIRPILGILKVLGAATPAIVHAPMPDGDGDASGWARRLRESALALLRDPELSAPPTGR
jgi:sugar phosphate isomerase/epimerase